MQKFNLFNANASEPKNKESKGKEREAINFEDYFIDDYQHYPLKEQQKVYQWNELILSVSLVSLSWSSMLVEDLKVAIPDKTNPEGQHL
jgi:hypothetical protein